MGEQSVRRVMVICAPGDQQQLPSAFQRTAVGSLIRLRPGIFVNRPVRTRMPGGVGAGGEKPPATRCTPGMGVNLWGESPLYVNPVNMLNILTKVLAEGKGVIVRLGLKEAGVQSYEPSLPRTCSGEQKWHTRPSLRVSQHNMTKTRIQSESSMRLRCSSVIPGTCILYS